jgi:cell division protein ZapA (FtsZ GTPase activity inhibitor)
MAKKVEVRILNQPFVFVGEDENRIVEVAQFVDGQINKVISDYGIISTMNAVIMTIMKVADEYLDMKRRVERVESSTLRLLRKVEEVEFPCGVRDK